MDGPGPLCAFPPETEEPQPVTAVEGPEEDWSWRTLRRVWPVWFWTAMTAREVWWIRWFATFGSIIMELVAVACKPAAAH